MKLMSADRTPPPPSELVREARPTSPAIELARVAATGDVQATAKLLRDVAPSVTSAVRAILGGGDPDLDDVVQQAMIALVQALPQFRGECEPAGYASRIAVRAALAARRRARLHASRTEELSDEAAIPHAEGSPDAATSASRRTAIVRELLETIPEEQAECLAFRVVLGWSLDEVSRACGAPINTVRSRVRLAKEALRKRIEADPRLLEELEVQS